ncbi:MAG: alkaline phosphatase family protein [Dehalococcoidia bacterium]|nr:alkaline phosphatase family protein [Dehalococcoidia bacterium]
MSIGGREKSHMVGNNPDGRMLVIGLDSATLDLIGPWVKAGKLPHMARLIKEGASGELESVPNMNSAPAWSSIVTGKNPGKHGIFWFVEDDPTRYGYTYVNASFRTAKPIWQLLSEAGRRVGVINVPISYPADPLNGFMLAGIDTPGVDAPGFCYPPNLYHDLHKELGKYIIEPGLPSLIKAGRIDEAVGTLYETIIQRTRYARRLIMEQSWDFFFIVYTSLDSAGHFFWKYMDPEHFKVSSEERDKYEQVIFNVYKMLDDAIGELTDMAGPDTRVMVISDHGMGPTDARDQMLPYWLESIGLLKFKAPSDNGKTQTLMNLGRRVIMDVLAHAYRQVDRRLRREAKLRLANLFPRLRNAVELHMELGKIDWPRTKAYVSAKRPEIWINLKGRQPQGIVEPGAEYDELCALIDEKLRELRDPATGEPYVERVVRREEIYSGPWVERSPDLLVCFRRGGWMDSAKLGNRTVAEIKRTIFNKDPALTLGSGHHTSRGIVLLWGEGIRPGSHTDGAHLYDIAPTLLYLMRSPIPSELDGRVLTEVIEPGFLAARPIERAMVEAEMTSERSVFSGEDEEVIAKRLRDLGYVE